MSSSTKLTAKDSTAKSYRALITNNSRRLFETGYIIGQLTDGEFKPARSKCRSQERKKEDLELLDKAGKKLKQVLAGSAINGTEWHVASTTLNEIKKITTGAGGARLRQMWMSLTHEERVKNCPILGWALLGRIVALKWRSTPLREQRAGVVYPDYAEILSRCLQVQLKTLRGWLKGPPSAVYCRIEKQIRSAEQNLPDENNATPETKGVFVFRNNFKELWLDGDIVWNVTKVRAATTIVRQLFDAFKTKDDVKWSSFRSVCSYETPQRFLKQHPKLRGVIDYRICPDRKGEWDIFLKRTLHFTTE